MKMSFRKKLKIFLANYGYIPVTLAISYIIFGVVLAYGFVPTQSMEPTIRHGSVYMGSRLSYMTKDVSRGDIVVFRKDGVCLVKRVVGMPGESVIINNGQVYIDSYCLDESAYLTENTVTLSEVGLSFIEYKVPEDCYFVMGDNRTNSSDSRFWQDSNFVNKSDIVSDVWFSAKIPLWDSIMMNSRCTLVTLVVS